MTLQCIVGLLQPDAGSVNVLGNEIEELTYDERSGPTARKKLKKIKRQEQNNLCAVCGEALPDKYAVLDRFNAVDGYTQTNTRLIHQDCDIQTQSARGYS